MKKLILSVIAIVSCDVCFSQKDHSTRETLLFSEINDYRNSLGIEDVEYDSVAYLVAKRQSGYQSKLDSLTANQNIDIPNFEESATFEEAIEKITKVKTIGGMLCARIYEKNGTIQRTDLERTWIFMQLGQLLLGEPSTDRRDCRCGQGGKGKSAGAASPLPSKCGGCLVRISDS